MGFLSFHMLSLSRLSKQVPAAIPHQPVSFASIIKSQEKHEKRNKYVVHMCNICLFCLLVCWFVVICSLLL